MPSISQQLASRIELAQKRAKDFHQTAEKLLIDIAGLCVAARKTDYVVAAVKSWESNGRCTAIGHERALDSAGAAFVNGTAAHGEDFDDTFEGGPVHAGAVIVPAGLAVAQRGKVARRGAPAGGAAGRRALFPPRPGG